MKMESLVRSTLSYGLTGLASDLLTKKIGVANFANVSNSSVAVEVIIILVVVIIALLVTILLCVAVYRLTDSGVQAILYLFFGGLYLSIALLYYAFTDHKFCKVKA